MLSFFVALDHWNYSLQVEMLLCSDTLSHLLDNQSFLFLLSVCLAEKQQLSILYFHLTQQWSESRMYCTGGDGLIPLTITLLRQWISLDTIKEMVREITIYCIYLIIKLHTAFENWNNAKKNMLVKKKILWTHQQNSRQQKWEH